MGLYNIELGFWSGLLVTAALVLLVWGLLYATTLVGAITWFLLIFVVALTVYLCGKRAMRRAIRGGGRR